jgi:hypothetical protein
MAQQQAVGIDSVDRFASNPASAEAAAPFRAWAVDPATFSTHKISALRHNFHLHPLMQLPRLAELAKAL